MQTQSDWVRAYLTAAFAAGWVVAEVQAGDEPYAVADHSPDTLTAAFADVEDMWVGLRQPGGGRSFLWFVWQGPDATYPDGDEVLADYGVTLDTVVEKVAADMAA